MLLYYWCYSLKLCLKNTVYLSFFFFFLFSIWFFVCLDLQNLKILGLTYFLYLFLFSGLEYTLSFLTHQRFQFSRYRRLISIYFFPGYVPKSWFKVCLFILRRGFIRLVKTLRKQPLHSVILGLLGRIAENIGTGNNLPLPITRENQYTRFN